MKHDHSSHRRFIVQVRAVLLDKWDPIGIGDNPMLKDEYDAYLADIVRMLEDSSTTPVTISDYLMNVENNKLGLPSNPTSRLVASKALMELVKSDDPRC